MTAAGDPRKYSFAGVQDYRNHKDFYAIPAAVGTQARVQTHGAG
nr:MAG TPA: hypothetical protein [Caudoviricetes sp.]